MSMVLNTNIPSMRAQFAMEASRKDLEEAMERLSTGKRINRAADDAAGLTMVTRMTSQINGLTAATKKCQRRDRPNTNSRVGGRHCERRASTNENTGGHRGK